MSVWIAGAAVVGTVGGIYSANKSAGAAQDATREQVEAADRGIAEQRRQFDAIQQLLSPYVAAGNGAIAGQQNLLGLNGQPAQQSAIDGIQTSAQFGALAQQGENAILANGSATGGLRGGSVQAALAQFRPQLLSGLIDQQYQRLGGLSSMGQNAAAGVGNAGMATGNQITQLLGQQGAAQAGGALAQGKAYGQMATAVTGGIGQLSGMAGGVRPPTNGGTIQGGLF